MEEIPMTLLEGETWPNPFQQVCRAMETHPHEAWSLETLSTMAGLSAGHFQRRFKAAIGVSPKQYLIACRMGQFKQALRQGDPVTDALYAAGFGASSRLYSQLDNRLGMTPKQYRRGGKGLAISYASARSSLGMLLMAATDRGLCFLQFGQSDEALLKGLHGEYPQASLSPMSGTESEALFQQWIEALEAHLRGERLPLNLPLDIQGTAFQSKVWDYLQKIPYGQVQSYTEVAIGIGQPKAARAVASACAANHLAIVVPCHRVIRGSGELGGYRWGLAVKRALLDQEKRISQAEIQKTP
jgi:AraC family transcriptional regulator of adaptative response/methylated-DNA-[protein]-cysteine methyltransferase